MVNTCVNNKLTFRGSLLASLPVLLLLLLHLQLAASVLSNVSILCPVTCLHLQLVLAICIEFDQLGRAKLPLALSLPALAMECPSLFPPYCPLSGTLCAPSVVAILMLIAHKCQLPLEHQISCVYFMHKAKLLLPLSHTATRPKQS